MGKGATVQLDRQELHMGNDLAGLVRTEKAKLLQFAKQEDPLVRRGMQLRDASGNLKTDKPGVTTSISSRLMRAKDGSGTLSSDYEALVSMGASEYAERVTEALRIAANRFRASLDNEWQAQAVPPQSGHVEEEVNNSATLLAGRVATPIHVTTDLWHGRIGMSVMLRARVSSVVSRSNVIVRGGANLVNRIPISSAARVTVARY